jgi:hypothetical protein
MAAPLFGSDDEAEDSDGDVEKGKGVKWDATVVQRQKTIGGQGAVE